MSTKKRARFYMFIPSRDGNQAWPGAPLDIGSDGGEVIVKDRGPEAEADLRVVFASMLDPRFRAKEQHDEVAVDLIELLLADPEIDPAELHATQLLLRHLCVQSAPHLNDHLQHPIVELVEALGSRERDLAAEAEAFAACTRLIEGKTRAEEDRVLQPVAEVASLMTTDGRDPGEEEWKRALLRMVCALFERPSGSRIDPAVLPLPLVRLYFALAQAQRESSEHHLHQDHRLAEASTCPICEIADCAVEHARRATVLGAEDRWTEAATELAQMGMALGTLGAQRNEAVFNLGAKWTASAVNAYTAKSEKNRPRIEARERRIKELLADGTGRKVTAIDRKIAKEFGCTADTAKRQRQEIQKRMKKGGGD